MVHLHRPYILPELPMVKGIRDGATSEARASPLFGKWATAS